MKFGLDPTWKKREVVWIGLVGIASGWNWFGPKYVNSKIIWCSFGLVSKPLARRVGGMLARSSGDEGWHTGSKVETVTKKIYFLYCVYGFTHDVYNNSL